MHAGTSLSRVYTSSRRLLHGFVIGLGVFWCGFHSTGAEAGDGQSIAQRSYAPRTRAGILGRSAPRRKALPQRQRPASQAIASRSGPQEGAEAYAELIARYSRRYALDPHLVRAIIQVESAGNARAVSPQGASGLMQLLPSTAAQFGTTNVFDPEQNIASGTAYLRSLLDRYRSLELALWAYNAGPGAVAGGRVPAETRAYVPKVLKLRRYYRTRAGT